MNQTSSKAKRRLATVILAAGKGTRMKSDLPKVLHQVCGKPMIQYVIETAHQIGSDRIIVIVGYQADRVKQAIQALAYDFPIDFVLQEPQLGTGHAVQQAYSVLSDYTEDDEVVVLSGDVPLIQPSTLQSLLTTHREDPLIVGTLLTAQAVDPTGCGRIIHDSETGYLQEIIEEKDIVSDQIRNITEVNTGTYAFQAKLLFETLPLVKCENKQQEYYLPDVLKIWAQQKLRLATAECDFSETQGVNTLNHLQQVEADLIKRGN